MGPSLCLLMISCTQTLEEQQSLSLIVHHLLGPQGCHRLRGTQDHTNGPG